MDKMGERVARLEANYETVAENQEAILSELKHINKSLDTGKGFRLGLLAALPIGGGSIGALLQRWFSAGGPTG